MKAGWADRAARGGGEGARGLVTRVIIDSTKAGGKKQLTLATRFFL